MLIELIQLSINSEFIPIISATPFSNAFFSRLPSRPVYYTILLHLAHEFSCQRSAKMPKASTDANIEIITIRDRGSSLSFQAGHKLPLGERRVLTGEQKTSGLHRNKSRTATV